MNQRAYITENILGYGSDKWTALKIEMRQEGRTTPGNDVLTVTNKQTVAFQLAECIDKNKTDTLLEKNVNSQI